MRIILAILIMLTFSLAQADENLLIGKWKSDKEKTTELIKNSKELSSKQKKVLLDKIEFGQLVLDISQNKIIAYYKGEKDISEYRVLETTSSSLKIEEYDDFLKKNIIKIITVKNGVMYIPSNMSPSIIEAFDKIE